MLDGLSSTQNELADGFHGPVVQWEWKLILEIFSSVAYAYILKRSAVS